MNKILSTEQAIHLAKTLHEQHKHIVLVGGCFDILHVGHLAFLEEAKKQGDVLFVFLEADETIKKQKGENRPINTQDDRAKMLAALEIIDYVITLPVFTKDTDYDNLVIQLKPAIIATTQGDPNRHHKKRQADLTHAQVVDVVSPIENRSTSRLIQVLKEI